MQTLEVIEEDFHEYQGPVDLCKSGGAGGGSPGSTAYPAYMQATHNQWLDNTGTDAMVYSITALMNIAMSGPSPFAGFPIVNVDQSFLGQYGDLSSYISPYERLTDLGCLNVDDMFNSYITDDGVIIANLIQAESDLMDDEVLTKIMPKFHAGMIDANAVQSSSFVLGEALIWGQKIKALAKSDAEIRRERLVSGQDIALKRTQLSIEYNRLLVTISIEAARIYTAARHDVDGFTAELAAKDRLFDLSIYQYGVNVMSSLHGSAVSPPDPGSGKSGFGGAISGAMSGAAMGYMVSGSVFGAAIGGAVGLAASIS